MKKFAKLSLVAAVAVAGMTSANAGSLEDAIKGVSISGKVQIRYNEGDGTSSNSNNTEVEVTAKVPVNDKVTAVIKVDHNSTTSDTASAGSEKLDLEDIYLSYNNAGVTVNVGQQNIPARFSYGKQGDGIVALTSVGGATVGAAYFMNNNVTTDGDVASVLAKGSVGGVALSAQVADIEDTVKYTELTASTTVAGVKLSLAQNTGDYDAGADAKLTVVKASGKIGAASVAVGYGTTDADNSSATGALIGDDGMNNAANFGVWQVSADKLSDAELTTAKVTLPLTSSVSLTAAYLDGEYGATNTDISETFGQISYKMSKNFSTYARISEKEDNNVESTLGRVQLLYTF